MTGFPILIFAAGLGTRMAHLTRDRPKPLIDVAGATLLDRSLALTQTPTITRRVVNVHYKGDMIRDHLRGRDVVLSDETEELLETGGGLRKALPLLGDSPVMTLNSDAIWKGPNPIVQLAAAWREGMEALLILVPPAQARGHLGTGDFTLAPDGQLTRGPGFVYSGLQIIRTESLQSVADRTFSLNRVWDAMIARGGVHGIVYDGKWCDVGHPAAIEAAEGLLSDV